MQISNNGSTEPRNKHPQLTPTNMTALILVLLLLNKSSLENNDSSNHLVSEEAI